MVSYEIWFKSAYQSWPVFIIDEVSIKSPKKSRTSVCINIETDSEKENIEIYDTDSEDERDVEENWRGKNTPIRNLKRRARFSILNPQDVDILCKKIIILPNGNKTKIKKITTSITNTCAFDALSHALACALHDFKSFKSYAVEQSKNNAYCRFIVNMINQTISHDKIIFERTNILKEVFKCRTKRTSNNFSAINCNGNVNNLYEKLLAGTLKVIYTCNCNPMRKVLFNTIPIDVKQLYKKGFERLSQCIDLNFIEVPCKNCLKIPTVEAESILFMDVQELRVDINIKIDIENIEKSFSLKGEIFELSGCIEYIPSVLGPTKVGHYIAHSRRCDSKWESYDDQSLNMIQRKSRIIAHTIIYLKKNM